MIYSAKYNGINFSGDFNRSGGLVDYSAQRRKGIFVKQDCKYLCFECDYVAPVDYAKLWILGDTNSYTITKVAKQLTENNTKILFIFYLLATDFTVGDNVSFQFEYSGQFIHSEIYKVEAANSSVCYVVASNNDNRHGYLTDQAFGFFRFSRLHEDFFVNKKTEYEYSYGRKKILSSENQIGKRLTFHDLTMYQANLLKWLCNCENLTIDGVQYQLISDFTEAEADPKSEVKTLTADFVEVNQSFFVVGANQKPVNIFCNQFFN